MWYSGEKKVIMILGITYNLRVINNASGFQNLMAHQNSRNVTMFFYEIQLNEKE